MCGICGFIGFEDKNLIKKMCDILSHRGPDDSGYYYGNNATLGHRRLSIIDLKSGHQPIHNEDENIWVVFNGEIYNYLKLKTDLEKKGHIFYTSSDTEVLVHLYEEFGINFSDKLDGMFSFAIWDDENGILLLSRDRIGKKPLYYLNIENGILFASEIKAILEYDIEKKLNYDVLSHFFTYRSTPNSETLFENIKKVPPGSILYFDNRINRINISKYYGLDKKVNINFSSEKEIINVLKNKLREAVKKRLMSEVPLGAYLSGGVDSSSIVAIASNLYNEDLNNEILKTFSVGFGASTDELEYAKETANFFGTDHSELYVEADKISDILPKIIWHLDEPIADPATIPVYLMSALTKKYVSVVLTGEGADELFAGYPKYKLFSDFLKPIPDNWKYKLYKYSPPSNIFDEKEKEKLFLDNRFIKNGHEKDILINKDKITLNELMKKDIEYWLPNYLLMKVDKMTMAHGLEARAPFLDNELIELSLTIPASLKVRNLTGKYILRKAMADILPKDITNRKKRGFPMPLNNWLKGDLKELLIQNLSDSEIIQSLFHKEYTEKIIDEFEKSINPIKKMRSTFQAWTLLTFSIWHDIYLG